VRLLLLLTLSTGCCGVLPGDSCGSPGPPPPDTCSDARTGLISLIEIGRDDDVFTPYHDGDMPKVVVGGQGSEMMGLRLRITPAGDVPPCLMQRTEYLPPADGHSTTPLRTYYETDGSFTTKPLWIPGYLPDAFDVRVTSGQGNEAATATVHLGNVDM
jgi:hypothetical protein